MYFLTNYYKKLYDVEHFYEKDNYYFLILNHNMINCYEYIYQQIKSNRYNNIDQNNQEQLSIDTNENIEEISLAPIKIIYGHFYNDFNDIIYHPVDKHTGEILNTFIGREFYDNILRFYGHIFCMNKSLSIIQTYVNLFKKFPELYLDVNGNLIDKIFYIDNTGNLIYNNVDQNTNNQTEMNEDNILQIINQL